MPLAIVRNNLNRNLDLKLNRTNNTHALDIDVLLTSPDIRKYEDVISISGVRISIIVLYILVILIATIGNVLVILVIYKRRSLRRNPAVVLILNLATCDLISCVIYRPLLLFELFLPFTSKRIFHDQMRECKAASYFQGMLAGK